MENKEIEHFIFKMCDDITPNIGLSIEYLIRRGVPQDLAIRYVTIAHVMAFSNVVDLDGLNVSDLFKDSERFVERFNSKDEAESSLATKQ